MPPRRSPPTCATCRLHRAQRPVDQTSRDHRPWTSRIPDLLEALAYAGAAVDPTLALAARRFARVRDEALGQGR